MLLDLVVVVIGLPVAAVVVLIQEVLLELLRVDLVVDLVVLLLVLEMEFLLQVHLLVVGKQVKQKQIQDLVAAVEDMLQEESHLVVTVVPESSSSHILLSVL